MKPFEPLQRELQSLKGLVKRSTFLRVLRRIADLSGVQLAPLSRSSETPTGAAYTLTVSDEAKPWGVSFVDSMHVRVGAGCVQIQGNHDHYILSSASLAVGLIGYVGVSANVRYEIGADNSSIQQKAEWMGWVSVTANPSLTFKASPPTSYASIDFSTVTSDPAEIFVPLAYIENGAVTNLIRDGLIIRLIEEPLFPQPLYTIVLV